MEPHRLCNPKPEFPRLPWYHATDLRASLSNPQVLSAQPKRKPVHRGMLVCTGGNAFLKQSLLQSNLSRRPANDVSSANASRCSCALTITSSTEHGGAEANPHQSMRFTCFCSLGLTSFCCQAEAGPTLIRERKAGRTRARNVRLPQSASLSSYAVCQAVPPTGKPKTWRLTLASGIGDAKRWFLLPRVVN
jgi:hypothetical protein